jgi:GTP-binding protein YchF
MPNVGKSTIFNALAQAGAPMENYPFCTIDANHGIVAVPDERLEEIGRILGKASPIPTRIEFVDVAGLVRGASRGEGLGNRFLGHIRGVDALAHVVRCFRDPDVAHVEGDVDPARDIETIETELLLADLEVLERAREKLVTRARSGDAPARSEVETIESLTKELDAGRPLRGRELSDAEQGLVRRYGLITAKPVVFVANIDEQAAERELTAPVRAHAERSGASYMELAGKLEEEISELPDEEKQEYLEALGVGESALRRLITTAYGILELITFYTVTTDLQAWTVRRGTTAPVAAGRIHTDFERGFIRAEVYHYDDLVRAGSEAGVRHGGVLRIEGRDYVVADGDIIHFLFNV